MELTKEVLQQLAEPFPAKVIQWKPQATRKEGDKALAVAYIDARDVMRRLDDVVGGEWGFYWEPIGDTAVKGILTVCGVTRSDVGEEGDGPMGKTIKAAVSDALKRCAVHFGIGRYLYYLGGTWVAYDAQFKRLKETPKLPKWALPGEHERVPQDAPAVAVDEADDDAPEASDNGHVAPPQPTTATAQQPQASGNGHDAPSEGDAEPPEWQGQFFGWLKQAAEKQGLEMVDDLYGTLKNLGHMRPHLAEYDKLYEAQKDAMGGMRALVASGGPS